MATRLKKRLREQIIQVQGEYPYSSAPSVRGLVWAGVLSGLLAGAVLATVCMVQSARDGLGVLFPVQLMAGVFYGVDVILGGAGPFWAGLALNSALSAGLGVLFSLALRPDARTGDAVWGGLLFGFGVWTVQTYLLLPWLNPTFAERLAFVPGTWLFAHLCFGASLGVVARLRRRFVRRSGHAVPSSLERPRRAA